MEFISKTQILNISEDGCICCNNDLKMAAFSVIMTCLKWQTYIKQLKKKSLLYLRKYIVVY